MPGYLQLYLYQAKHDYILELGTILHSCFVLLFCRHCLWILGNGKTLHNSESVWKKLIVDAKNRGCFYNIQEDKCLATDSNKSFEFQDVQLSKLFASLGEAIAIEKEEILPMWKLHL